MIDARSRTHIARSSTLFIILTVSFTLVFISFAPSGFSADLRAKKPVDSHDPLTLSAAPVSAPQPSPSENNPQSLSLAEVMELIKSVTDTSTQTIEVAKREMENQGKLTEGLLRIDNKLLREIKEHYEQYTYWLTLAAMFLGVVLGTVGYYEYLSRQTLKQAAAKTLTKANEAAEGAENTLTRAKSCEQDIQSIRTRLETNLKNVHNEAALEAALITRYTECSQLSGAVRVLKVLGHFNESTKSETAQMITSMLQNMLAAANNGIELTRDKVSRWWMVFRVMKGVALKDFGDYEAALAEVEQVLAARELEDGYKSAPYYNAACYACLLNRQDEALAYLEHAIKLDIKYKTKARTDPDFQTLSSDTRFEQLAT